MIEFFYVIIKLFIMKIFEKIKSGPETDPKAEKGMLNGKEVSFYSFVEDVPGYCEDCDTVDESCECEDCPGGVSGYRFVNGIIDEKGKEVVGFVKIEDLK
jgi:hypothetical protein